MRGFLHQRACRKYAKNSTASTWLAAVRHPPLPCTIPCRAEGYEGGGAGCRDGSLINACVWRTSSLHDSSSSGTTWLLLSIFSPSSGRRPGGPTRLSTNSAVARCHTLVVNTEREGGSPCSIDGLRKGGMG